MQQTKTYRKYKENSKERFVRYSEGAEMYHVSVSKFMQMAKDAKAFCFFLYAYKITSFQGNLGWKTKYQLHDQ